MHTPLITIIQTRTSIIRELILHITKRHQPSHFINNLVGFTPSVDGLSFYLPGGCRATNAEEVLEVVEGWALWWQRPRWSPERKHNKLEGIITGLYGHIMWPYNPVIIPYISTKINEKSHWFIKRNDITLIHHSLGKKNNTKLCLCVGASVCACA